MAKGTGAAAAVRPARPVVRAHGARLPRGHPLRSAARRGLRRQEKALSHGRARAMAGLPDRRPSRSEEHTSELQSQSNLVCRLLLEKKKKKKVCPRMPDVRHIT